VILFQKSKYPKFVKKYLHQLSFSDQKNFIFIYVLDSQKTVDLFNINTPPAKPLADKSNNGNVFV